MRSETITVGKNHLCCFQKASILYMVTGIFLRSRPPGAPPMKIAELHSRHSLKRGHLWYSYAGMPLTEINQAGIYHEHPPFLPTADLTECVYSSSSQ